MTETMNPTTQPVKEAPKAVAASVPPVPAVAGPPKPLVMRNELQPAWGMGVVISEDLVYRTWFFEDGSLHKFAKDKSKVLVPATPTPAELTALQAKASGHKVKSPSRPRSSVKGKPRPAASIAAHFPSFQAQLALFERLFAGGFTGETFTLGERGRPGVQGKEGYKEAGSALAKQELAKARFEGGDPVALFEMAKKVLQSTNIVFPIEGSIPFSGLAEASRQQALDGLKQLLHAEGEYADRLERFGGAVELKDKEGTRKNVSWPLATIWGGLFDPTQHTCVKPTHFASQGAMLGLPVETALPVTAEKYTRFLRVALKTKELLEAAGHKPRDLMDVYSFIWRTHAEKVS